MEGTRKQMKNVTKKLIGILLATMLLLSMAPVIYGDGNDDIKMSFPDVSENHWGHPYVTKLALQGVILGDNLGNFNPDQNVRQQDAIIMAINFMGLNEVVESADSIGVLPFQVDDYARPYVQLALDIGLLDAREELATVTDSEDENWGKRAASREWIAKITIRAVQQEERALDQSGRVPSFTDADAISAWALGYINRAVELEIVSGFDDGEFKPKDAVTRAQMAVFLSRSESYLNKAPKRVRTGLVTDVQSDEISIREADGSVHTYGLASNAIVYDSIDQIKYANRQDIQPFYEVYVIMIDETIYFVDIQNDEVAMESFSGTVVSRNFENSEERKLTLQFDEEFQTFTLAKNVVVVDPDGRGMNVGAIVKDSKVTLQRQLEADSEEIVQIVVQSIPVNKEGEATITSVDESNITIEQDDDLFTFPIGEKLLLTYEKRILEGVKDLNEGDRISYKVQNGLFVEISVLKPAIPYLTYDEGFIDHINQDRVYLLKSSQDLKGYFINDDVEIVLSGKEDATVNDLHSGDRVTLTLNEANEVVRIQIFDREIEKKIQVQIVYYDKETNSLMLRLNRSETALFKLTEQTVIRTDTARIQLDNFGNLFSSGKLVDIIYSDDQLMEVKLSSYYDGEIVAFDRVNRTLSIRTDQFGKIDFAFENAIVITPEDDNKYLDDLDLGDVVRISLNSNQEEISLIQLNKTIIYELQTRNVASRYLNVRTADGESKEIYVNVQTPILLANGKRGALSDIPEDHPIMISYMGTTIESIRVPELTRGRITSVNLNEDSVLIAGNNGKNANFKLTEEVHIVKDDYVYDTLLEANLQENDRVEIAKDHEGNLYIYVLATDTKKFWQYDTKTDVVSFRRSNLNEPYQYNVSKQAFVHIDGKAVSMTSFANGDDIIIYYKGTTIMEMTKK